VSQPFDSQCIAQLGWRQGSVLGGVLSTKARSSAPPGLTVADTDWLIVTSHDCDIVNVRLEREPVVEVLRAVPSDRSAPDPQQHWGRSPRQWQVAVAGESTEVTLECQVHERWPIPRQWLAEEAPGNQLPPKERRAMAEWLAKRYVRPAFPSAFDQRWHSRLKQWFQLLRRESGLLQGVYLRLSSSEELPSNQAYGCDFIVVVPASARTSADWPTQRERLETAIERFWGQFEPGIECEGVEVLGTDEITLEAISAHQRFDADWVSFVDDTEVISIQRDFEP